MLPSHWLRASLLCHISRQQIFLLGLFRHYWSRHRLRLAEHDSCRPICLVRLPSAPYVHGETGLTAYSAFSCSHKKPQLISIGTGTVTFFGFVGRNLGISLAGSVFGNMLLVNLHKYAPGLPPGLVAAVQNNAGAVYSAVPEACPFPP